MNESFDTLQRILKRENLNYIDSTSKKYGLPIEYDLAFGYKSVFIKISEHYAPYKLDLPSGTSISTSLFDTDRFIHQNQSSISTDYKNMWDRQTIEIMKNTKVYTVDLYVGISEYLPEEIQYCIDLLDLI